MAETAVVGAPFFDPEDESLLDQEQEPLSWRGDPTETHSDWSVDVTISAKDSLEPTKRTIHVHKAILGVGPRSSTYFATLFQSKFRESHDATSQLELDSEEEMESFELVLDYIYSGQVTGLCTQNAVVLRSQARYFQCRLLLQEVNEFISRDLTQQTAPVYLQTAFDYNDVKLQESAQKLLVQHFFNLPVSFLESVGTELCIPLLKSVQEENESQHRFKSRVLYSFFESHPDARNAKLLTELTLPLSEIDATVVSGFLELIAQVSSEDKEEELDNLCQACAKTLVSDWRLLDTELCFEKFLHPSVEGDFRGTGRIAMRVMGSGLEKAKEDYASLQQERDSLHETSLRQGLQLENASQQLHEIQEALAQAKHKSQQKDLEILELTISHAKEKRLAQELQDEVQKLKESGKQRPRKKSAWS